MGTWCAGCAGWRPPRSLNLLLATLPSAETKRPLEMLASSRQVRERAGVRAARCLHCTLLAWPSQGGRVVQQLSELAGPSAYGAVVLGCFVLKNYQRTRPSGPPCRCRRSGAPSRWFANKTASAEKGKETCPKWRVAGAQSPAPRAQSSCRSVFLVMCRRPSVGKQAPRLLRVFVPLQTASRLHCEGFGRKYCPGELAACCLSPLPRVPVPVCTHQHCSARARVSSGL